MDTTERDVFEGFDDEDFFAEEEDVEEVTEETAETVEETEESKSEEETATTDDSTTKEKDFAAMQKEDEETLKKEFPSVDIPPLTSLKNLKRYGELRDKGLSPKEALLASNPEILVKRAERVGASNAASKQHLQALGRKQTKSHGATMTASVKQNIKNFVGDNVAEENLAKYYAMLHQEK